VETANLRLQGDRGNLYHYKQGEKMIVYTNDHREYKALMLSVHLARICAVILEICFVHSHSAQLKEQIQHCQIWRYSFEMTVIKIHTSEIPAWNVSRLSM